MRKFQRIGTGAGLAAFAVLVSASFAAAEQGGRYWVPTREQGRSYSAPAAIEPATYRAENANAATKSAKRSAITRRRELAAHDRIGGSAAEKNKEHRLIIQVNASDPAVMNLALNNATNVVQYYKDAGEKVRIEVVTFGPGLHMLRADTSPVKPRIEEMALSTPEVSFKACGNTQEKMQKSENKDIPIVPQAEIVTSGVVRVMELQEKGWNYVKP